jgi:hypothetical protein
MSQRILTICSLLTVLFACGPFASKKNESQAPIVKEGEPKTGCIQGVLMSGFTGERLPVTTESEEDFLGVLIKGKLKKAKATSNKDFLKGEYTICGIPLENDYPLLVRYAGYQDFEGTIKVAATAAANSGNSHWDVRSDAPTEEANVRIFPMTALAKDFEVSVHHNGAALEGAQVTLRPTGGNFGTVAGGTVVAQAGHRYPTQSVTTDTTGKALFPAANLAWGANYSYLVLPPDGGAAIQATSGSFRVGASTTTGVNPYLLHVELAIANIGLIIVSQSTEVLDPPPNTGSNDPSATGSISYWFNRDIELVPGTADGITATLQHENTAELIGDNPGNDATEQVQVQIDGSKMTLTPAMNVAADVKKEPGLRVTMAGVTVRPTEGQRRQETVTVNPTVSFFGGLEPVATSVTLTAGGDQVGMASTVLPDSITVQVKDQQGNNMNGETVTFAVSQGGGSVNNGVVVTSSGLASTNWTLGGTGAQELTVTVSGLTPVSVPATIGTIQLISGDGQKRLEKEDFSAPLVARLVDHNTVPIQGKSLTFTLDNGAAAGSLAIGASNGASANGDTDASGNVSATWTAGDVTTTTPSGTPETVSVTHGNITLATPFEGIIQVPEAIFKNAGAGAWAEADPAPGVAFMNAHEVEIRDGNGDPIEGVTVNFMVDNDSLLTGASNNNDVVTDASGLASDTWTLGTASATHTLTIDVTDYTTAPVTEGHSIVVP